MENTELDKLFGVMLPQQAPRPSIKKTDMARTAKVIKTNTAELQFPFNREIIDRIKSLSGRRYDAAKKTWSIIFDFRNCFESERIFNEFHFDVDPEVKKLIEYFKAEAKDLAEGKVTDSFPVLQVPERVDKALQKMGSSMRPYQIEGFSAMVQWKKAINGCEMGLGKTLQALTAVEYQDAFPCLIICPASLKYNWEEEIGRFLPGRTDKVLDAKEIIYSGKDFYIINYDNIKKRTKDLERINFKSIIIDESHYIKNKKAQRSKAAIDLIKKIPVAYLLSGTIIENRPVELISQIDSIGQLNSTFGGFWKFVNRYCNAKSNGFGMDLTGAANIEELHLRMAKGFYFRRNKKDVLKDLPDKVYTKLNVEISNRKEYNSAENNLVNYLQNKVMEAKELKESLKGLSKEEKAELISQRLLEQEVKVNSAEHLVLMTTLRKVSAYGKIEAAKEWVTNFLEASNEKVLIFAWHTEAVIQLAEEFKCKAIYGGVDVKIRQQIVNNFQNNPEERVLVLNIKAGGVGLNLTKSSTVLFIEEPLNPALKMQAEDRAHRIGQKDTVNVYTMVGKETIDERIFQLVQEKLKVVNAVNAGVNTEESGDFSIMKELLKSMLNN